MEISITSVLTLMAVFTITGSSLATPIPNTWTGGGPFATGTGNQVVTAMAASADGQTVFSGTGSGTLFSYDYGYLVNVLAAGNGSGNVSSDIVGINCTSGSPNSCSATYLHGTVISLSAITLTGRSTFDGWSQDCSGVASCLLAITNTKNVSAVFGLGVDDAGPKARIQSSGSGYLSIYDAYKAAGHNQVVLAVQGDHPALSGFMNEAKTVTIKGGYTTDQNSLFITQGGYSNIAAPLKIDAGKIIAERINIKSP